MLKNQSKILKITKPKIRPEGKGAKVQRILGSDNPKYFDPFLMMDFFSSKQPNGFPDHPHRGFETVSYMKEGSFLHEDFKGHKGRIDEGDVQWMTAGKGIVHAEMPESKETDSVGFQLWINLRSTQKMIEPKYQEIKKALIPVIQKEQASIKVICGNIFGTSGPITPNTPVEYLDVFLALGGRLQKSINIGWNSFIYLYEGQLLVNGNIVENQSAVFFANGPEEAFVDFEAKSSGAKFLWLSGLPLKEPIVQYGPFVMNTQDQIDQTLEDYHSAKNGFEEVKNWSSGIRKLSENY